VLLPEGGKWREKRGDPTFKGGKGGLMPPNINDKVRGSIGAPAKKKGRGVGQK